MNGGKKGKGKLAHHGRHTSACKHPSTEQTAHFCSVAHQHTIYITTHQPSSPPPSTPSRHQHTILKYSWSQPTSPPTGTPSRHQHTKMGNFVYFCPPTSTPLKTQHAIVWIFLYICFAHPLAHHWGFSTPMFESWSFLPTHQHTIEASAHQCLKLSLCFSPTHQHTIEASAHQCLNPPLYVFCPPTNTPLRLQHTNGWIFHYIYLPTHQHTIEPSAHQCLNPPLYVFCPPTNTPMRLQHTKVWIFLYIFFPHPATHHLGFSTPTFESFTISFCPTTNTLTHKWFQLQHYKQGRAIRIGYCIVFTILVSIGFTQYLLSVLLFSQYNTLIFFLNKKVDHLERSNILV